MGIFLKLKSWKKNFESKFLRASWWSCFRDRNFFIPLKQFNRNLGIFRVVTRYNLVSRTMLKKHVSRVQPSQDTCRCEKKSWHGRQVECKPRTHGRTRPFYLPEKGRERADHAWPRKPEGKKKRFFLAFSALEVLNRFTMCYDGLETWSNSIHNSYICFWAGSMNKRRGIDSSDGIERRDRSYRSRIQVKSDTNNLI